MTDPLLPNPKSWDAWLLSLPIELFKSKAKDEKPAPVKPKFGGKRVA